MGCLGFEEANEARQPRGGLPSRDPADPGQTV